MRAKFRGRSPEDALEIAVELGERLEADIVGDVADAQVRIEKSDPGIFQANTRDVVAEFQPGALMKYLGEMKHAHPNRLRHISQREFLGLMLVDVLARL